MGDVNGLIGDRMHYHHCKLLLRCRDRELFYINGAIARKMFSYNILELKYQVYMDHDRFCPELSFNFLQCNLDQLGEYTTASVCL